MLLVLILTKTKECLEAAYKSLGTGSCAAKDRQEKHLCYA